MKRLYRSSTQRMVAGVLGGLAEYFNIDATILRLIFIVLLFISFFTLLLIYLAAALIIPEERDVY
ncbi:PspC domain-containing protein [Virgibacillus kimchii]